MNTRTLGGLVAALTTLALLAGCSDTGAAGAPPSAPGASAAAAPTPASGAAGAHNGADVTFLQGMIPHHRQAVDMTGLAATQAASPEVEDLANRIAAAQGPEIEQMNQMLTAWAAPAPAGGMGDMGGMGGMGGMAGMMSEDQMAQLGAAVGPTFDRMFLQMMIEHHRGAISQAQTELAQGQNLEAKQLAEKIISEQQAEITEMQTLLTRV